jgi:hypothetical protein
MSSRLVQLMVVPGATGDLRRGKSEVVDVDRHRAELPSVSAFGAPPKPIWLSLICMKPNPVCGLRGNGIAEQFRPGNAALHGPEQAGTGPHHAIQHRSTARRTLAHYNPPLSC